MHRENRTSRLYDWPWYVWLVLAAVATLTLVFPGRSGLRAKSSYEFVSGRVLRFASEIRNSKGGRRYYVVVEVEGGERELSLKGYFPERIRSLQPGDTIQAFVNGTHVVELRSSRGIGFTYDEHAVKLQEDNKTGRIIAVAGTVFFWVGTGLAFAFRRDRSNRNPS